MSKDHTEVAVTTIPNCNICTMAGDTTPAYADVMIPKYGSWGDLCEKHFFEYGCGLGLGIGQKLILKPTN